MKSIRIFVISSSLVLVTWLGASYMTEINPISDQNGASTFLTEEDPEKFEPLANKKVKTEEIFPVSHIH